MEFKTPWDPGWEEWVRTCPSPLLDLYLKGTSDVKLVKHPKPFDKQTDGI